VNILLISCGRLWISYRGHAGGLRSTPRRKGGAAAGLSAALAKHGAPNRRDGAALVQRVRVSPCHSVVK
jgi:hypothetical protein